MPFSFLMMSMAAAGALAAALAVIPLIVHLLHRQKVTPVAWGAMQFLLESPLRVRRRRKIDNWLLMLLRMAILMLIVFLLCRPVWKTSSMATSTPVDVAIVLDHSMSMGMREAGSGADAPVGGGIGGGAGTETLYGQGINITERIARMLPTSGTMSVVLVEHSPRVMTPVPIKMGLTNRAADGSPAGDWAKQLQELRALKPGMTKGDIPAGIEAARELLAHGYNTRKIIFVISDDQRTNWNPGDEKAWTTAVGHGDLSADSPPAIPIFSLPVKTPGGNSNLANVTVQNVLVLPEFLGVHRPAQIVATVSNSGGKELTNIPIVLEVDGKTITSRALPSLAVGESASVRFDHYFPEAGSHWVRVKADVVDALDADNAATAAVNVKSRLPVLVVDGQLTAGSGAGLDAFPQAGYLLAAMQPVDPTIDPVALIEPKVISVAELATLKGVRLEDYPIVVLNDVPRLTRETVDKLAAHAQAGNGVWLILGPRTEASFINDVLAKSTLLPMTAREIVHAPRPRPGDTQARWVTVDIKEPANRAVTLLTNAGAAEHSALSDVTLQAWWSVSPVAPEMRTVMATTTGDPLVLEMEMGKLGGRAVAWTTATGDVQWNNLRLVSGFCPLVNETLFNLASGQDAGEPRQVEAGRPLTWSGGGRGQRRGGGAWNRCSSSSPTRRRSPCSRNCAATTILWNIATRICPASTKCASPARVRGGGHGTAGGVLQRLHRPAGARPGGPLGRGFSVVQAAQLSQ